MSEENEQLIKTPGKFGENFMLERELGRGGMGGVYLGRDVMLDRPVAVKVMLKQYGEDAEFLATFKREAQSAAKLIHPNIAQIYSYGVVDNMPYIAMELVAGGSLLQIMNNAPEGKTDIPRVLKICEQVAQALRCAADQGLVHGDIKPDNILLDSNGNAKLVDFGLAGMQKDSDEIWGTPYYIAPEKLKKESVDYRSDMYNLGGTLYHALTGVAPFEGEDANAVVRKRFEGNPRKPSEIRPEISSAIDALVMKMLELNKQDRFPTFEALLAEFKEVMATGLEAAEDNSASPTPAAKPKSGSRRMMVRGSRKMSGMRLNSSSLKTSSSDTTSEDNVADELEPEDENSNIGKKVLLGFVGGLAAIGLLAGGIAWYVISSRNARTAEEYKAIIDQVARGHEAIQTTCRVAEKFGKDFQDFAAKATIECENATKKISEAVPEFTERLKPPLSAELLAAIALTNTPVVTVVSTNATNNVAVATNAVEKTAAVDSAKPSEKKEETPKAEDKNPVVAANDDDLETSTDPIEKLRIQLKKIDRKYSREMHQVGEEAVKDVNDLWNRAYSCQASAIKISVGVKSVLEAARKAETLTDNTIETMNALGELSSQVKELYEQVKGSKDVENVQKGITFIKSKGAKSLKQTTDNLFRRRAECEREKKKIEYEIEKLCKERGTAEARMKLVEEEVEAANTKFESIKSSKTLELLQWDSAIRELNFLKSNFKTTEGGLAIANQVKKIEAMKSVQTIFVKNMKGFQFRRGKLGKLHATVKDADTKAIRLLRDGVDSKATTFTVNWVRFYKEYHSNFNELIIQFIENGRKNCNPRLSLSDWADAMSGAALTLKIICGDDSAAATRGEQLAKDAAKAFPSYVRTLRMMFPEITFEDPPEE